MQLNDIMTKEFQHIAKEESIRHAAEMMRSLDVGFLPILEGEQVVGAVTDRDIVVRGIADGLGVDTPVSAVMSKGAHFKYVDEDITEAANLMEQEQIRRLMVLDRSDRCVGIVSLGDIATHTGDRRIGGEVLEEVSRPSH
jgi:CBS domain-containing protein